MKAIVGHAAALAKAMIVCGLVWGCGGRSHASGQPSSRSSFCQKWPDDHFYCDEPLLSAGDAATQIGDSQLVGPEAALVGIWSSSAGGLTPDGDQSLAAGAWSFAFYDGNGSLRWIGVNATGVERGSVEPRAQCEGERISVDGLSKQVSSAATLVEATYLASFEPGTFSIGVRREAACLASNGLSRTVVEFQLDTATERFPTVEFDGSGALVATCAVGGQFRGCRGE